MKDASNSRAIALKQINEEARQIGLEVILRDRPYKIPKGYTRWEDQCIGMAIAIQAITDTSGRVPQDLASVLHYHRSVLWLAKNAPVYLVDNALLRQVEQTDLPTGKNTLLEGLTDPPLPTVMFLLPNNAIISPDGGCLDSIIFHFSKSTDHESSTSSYRGLRLPRLKHLNDEQSSNLHWSAVDTETTVWFSGCYLTPEGEILFSEDGSLGLEVLNSKDREFTSRVRGIVLQLWLLASFMPSTFVTDQPATASRGFDNRSHRKAEPQAWHPRRLTLKEGDRASRRGGTGTHASPHAHWRRGHWRNTPVGPGRAERKLTWIRPMLINSGDR